MKPFARLAIVAAVGVYLLIVMGGIVRVTGSGLGCPDWPLCRGSFVPPTDLHGVIEYLHRIVALTVGLPLAALVVAAWRSHRRDPLIFRSVNLLVVLLIPQVLLGREVVLRELPAGLVAIHLGIALAILGLAIFVAVVAALRPTGVPLRYPQIVALSVVAVFMLLLSGAYTRGAGASWVCPGFPACPDSGSPLVDINLFHRFLGAVVGLLLLYQAITIRRHFPEDRRVRFWAWAAAGLLVLQGALGALQAVSGPSALLQGLHLAGAAATWAATAALGALVFCAARPTIDGRTVRGYVSLTKPRIISLLLVTTLGGMFLAGAPSVSVVLWTLLDGALAAGGANAINQFIDRDIDGVMGRTTLRPIPAGVVSPRSALVFGVLLVALALAIFVTFVNALSGMLAVGAMLYYVFIYTRWLKRSTPSNIVIGGAAGALPPVIGWTAVRGELGLLPIWLFAIVFYWTPPHFWALSLLIKREYEKARVPMLPIVRGDAETRRQIVLYSFLLVAITALLVPLGLLGPIYLVAALVLGAIFVYYALRLRREATTSAARRLFKFSLYYLALLFAAMVVDQRLTL